MTADDAEEYTQALGQSMSGGYRTLLLGMRLGVPQALGLTVEQWATERLGGYVRLSAADRVAASVDLVKIEGLSTRDAADILGVSHMTVGRDVAGTNVPPDELPQSENGDPVVTNVPPLDLHAAIRATDDAEDLDYLMGQVERIAEVRELQTTQPEKFAAAEIYEALRVAVEEAEQWQAHVDVRYPGRASEEEWHALVQRLQGITQQIEKWTARVNWEEAPV